MRASSLLFLAAGLGCSFDTVSEQAGSGELEETDTQTVGTSTTSSSATGTDSTGLVETTATTTTDAELTTSVDADDTEEPTAFVQELVLTNPDNYDFQDVPLLVTLTRENSLWSAIEPDLSNLRFVGSAEGTDIELPFEVGGTGQDFAQLWVLLPEVSSEADSFRVEYGPGVSSRSWAPGDVWSAYETVWHLGEDPDADQPQFHDSSGHERHISNSLEDRIPSDEMVPGIVGRAPLFAEGRELQISSSDWSDSNIGNRFTAEAWVQYEETPPSEYRTIVAKRNAYQIVGSRERNNTLEDPEWAVRDDQEDLRFATATGQSWNQGPGVWNYAVATFERNPESNQVRMALYIDGVAVASEEFSDYQPVQNGADFRIGEDLTAAVDEVRVSFEVRAPPWFDLQNRSMRDELLNYGDPMPLQ